MHCVQLVCLFLGFFILLLIDSAQALEGEAIIGGDDAIFGEFPYQASLQIYGKNFCGGGIIDDYHVVTAAHCVADSDGELHNYSIKIVAGIIDLGTEASTKITCNVEKVFIPKEFGHTDPKTRRIGDISVLKLKEPLNIQSNNLRKLELPEDKTYANEMAIVTGYGWNWVDVTMNALTERAEESGGSHQKLRFANAKVLSSAECQKNYVKNIAKQNICARVVQRQPSKPEGVCSGDSGGPLVHGGKTLIGIVSTSPVGCKETKAAAVYTRVSSYLDFIDKARKDQPDDTMLTTKLPISLWF